MTDIIDSTSDIAEGTAKRSRLWNLPGLRAIAPPNVEAPGGANGGELPPWNAPGTKLRENRRRAARGFYGVSLPGAPTTTRQAEILNTAIIGAPTGTSGIVIGRDVLSRTSVSHDPVTAYNAQPRLVSSPNVVICGDVGSGKSSLTKTVYALRPLVLAKRRAVVFDKKDQAGEGEYSSAVRHFGSEPIKFSDDGTGTRLNLLDPLIVRATGLKGQKRLLTTIARLASENEDAIGKWEGETIRAALKLTHERHARRTPVLADVMPHFAHVADLPDYQGLSPRARDRLHAAGLNVQFALNDLLEDYSGLIDGDTSKNVDLTGKLTSFDISQLPDDGPAVPVVMAIGHMWLLGRLRYDRGWATTCIYEEGWHILGGPSAKLARANQKLSRGLALSNVFNFHKGTDIPENSPGMAMIQEAQTVHVYRQSRPEDALWCQSTFGFDAGTAEQIERLGDGHHFFKFGSHPETIVQHIRSPWEKAITDTDEAFEAAGTIEPA